MAPPPLRSPPPSSPPPPAALPEELIEQILLRFPPGEPASLFRAALVCKRWRRLVSGPGFRRRFREFHRTAPTLGMLCNRDFVNVSHFVPATAFRPRRAERGLGRVMDARDGRVLLHLDGRGLSVWHPITGDEWKVPLPPQCTGRVFSWTAAVLCSAAASAGGCNHLDCHRGSFIVVSVACVSVGNYATEISIYTYSSNANAWSEPTCSQRPRYFVNSLVRSALVGNALYFGNVPVSTILKYNMQMRQVSWIQLPSSVPHRMLYALTTTEDGGLQLSIANDGKLYIWSTKDANEVDARWEQNRVVELNTMLPVDANLTSLFLVGSTDDLPFS